MARGISSVFLFLSMLVQEGLLGNEFCPEGETCPAKGSTKNHEKDKWSKPSLYPDLSDILDNVNADEMSNLLSSFMNTGDSSGHLLNGIMGAFQGNTEEDSNPLNQISNLAKLFQGGDNLDLLETIMKFTQGQESVNLPSMMKAIEALTKGDALKSFGIDSNTMKTFPSVLSSLQDGLSQLSTDEQTKKSMKNLGDVVTKGILQFMSNGIPNFSGAEMNNLLNLFMTPSNQEVKSDKSKTKKDDKAKLDSNSQSDFEIMIQLGKELVNCLMSIDAFSSGDLSKIDEVNELLTARTIAVSGKVDELLTEEPLASTLRSPMSIVAGVLYLKHDIVSVMDYIRQAVKVIKRSYVAQLILQNVPSLSTLPDYLETLIKSKGFSQLKDYLNPSKNSKPSKKSSNKAGKESIVKSGRKLNEKQSQPIDMLGIFKFLETMFGLKLDGPDIIVTIYKSLRDKLNPTSGFPKSLHTLINFLELDGLLDIPELLSILSRQPNMNKLFEKLNSKEPDMLEILQLLQAESFLNEVIKTSDDFITKMDIPIDKVWEKARKLEKLLPRDLWLALEELPKFPPVINMGNSTNTSESIRKTIEDTYFRTNIREIIRANLIQPVSYIWEAYLTTRTNPQCQPHVLCNVNKSMSQENPTNSFKILVAQFFSTLIAWCMHTNEAESVPMSQLSEAIFNGMKGVDCDTTYPKCVKL